ncbi:RNA polymerase sigma factor [Streptomyces sp. NPDC048251]|uniref:RNA polymerase sigma factor n=1 Tax=Streptomyces sp. NPDC048251 TaxID=3154501 RepID=UPI0034199274
MRYRDKILRALRCFGFDDQQNDELVQEALIRAMRSPKLVERLQHDPTVDPVPYMKRIAVNLAKSRLRQAGKEVPVGAEAELATLERHLREEEDMWELVLRNIPRISADQCRTVLSLQSQGWDDSQISGELGRPTGQIQVQRHRGVRALQQMPEISPHLPRTHDDPEAVTDGE